MSNADPYTSSGLTPAEQAKVNERLNRDFSNIFGTPSKPQPQPITGNLYVDKEGQVTATLPTEGRSR